LLQVADKTFNEQVQPALPQHGPGYGVFDIANARQAGINAIPRASG
jgi:hypothetical protein